MVAIAEISAIVAAAGVFEGFVIAVVQLRNLVKQRQADMVWRMFQAWNSY